MRQTTYRKVSEESYEFMQDEIKRLDKAMLDTEMPWSRESIGQVLGIYKSVIDNLRDFLQEMEQ